MSAPVFRILGSDLCRRSDDGKGWAVMTAAETKQALDALAAAMSAPPHSPPALAADADAALLDKFATAVVRAIWSDRRSVDLYVDKFGADAAKHIAEDAYEQAVALLAARNGGHR